LVAPLQDDGQLSFMVAAEIIWGRP
jgi:hypothetical protein